MVQPLYTTDKGKGDPEAGAAIGSFTDGAVINIKNSTVMRAEGGSKAAGIGAMYHTGVTVNITDSDVTAFGGNSSAGIGGSRVGTGDAADVVTVNIVNSDVNATGGQNGAGIGSGYNTYTSTVLASAIINIDAASNITAQGGQYSAGVGTGYNFGGPLELNVLCDTANIKGDKTFRATHYTIAQDIGYGALNKNNFGGIYTFVSTADELLALSGKELKTAHIILTNDIDMNGAEFESMYVYDDTNGAEVTFNGAGYTISNIVLADDGKLDQNGMYNVGLFHVGAGNYGVKGNSLTVSDLTIKDVTVNGYAAYCDAAVVVGYVNAENTVTLSNVDVVNAKVVNDYGNAAIYVGYVQGSTVTVSGCDVSGTCSVSPEFEDGAYRTDKAGLYAGTVNSGAAVTVTGGSNTSAVTNDYGRILGDGSFTKN